MTIQAGAVETYGLSPRVRGNPSGGSEQVAASGSIPACAGEPSGHALLPTGRSVYPRVCGGTPAPAYRRGPESGLSPRVRGNPSSCALSGEPGRSIPACAGEPHSEMPTVWARTVYPRVCGGTGWENLQDIPREGLSPRVRGNQIRPFTSAGSWRSIPACAGEPLAVYGAEPSLEVYPRVCGGTARAVELATSAGGLSPRVRGNRHPSATRRGTIGSIPACAGEPRLLGFIRTSPTVYPRVCGGTIEAP